MKYRYSRAPHPGHIYRQWKGLEPAVHVSEAARFSGINGFNGRKAPKQYARTCTAVARAEETNSCLSDPAVGRQAQGVSGFLVKCRQPPAFHHPLHPARACHRRPSTQAESRQVSHSSQGCRSSNLHSILSSRLPLPESLRWCPVASPRHRHVSVSQPGHLLPGRLEPFVVQRTIVDMPPQPHPTPYPETNPTRS